MSPVKRDLKFNVSEISFMVFHEFFLYPGKLLFPEAFRLYFTLESNHERKTLSYYHNLLLWSFSYVNGHMY